MSNTNTLKLREHFLPKDTLNKISIIPVEQDLSELINPGYSHENIAVPDCPQN